MAKRLRADEVLGEPTDDFEPTESGVDDGSETRELDALRQKLQDAEAKLEIAEERARAAEASAERGLKTKNDSQAYAGPNGGYLFRVGPRNPSQFPGLEAKEIRAVDASEALRWYCESSAWPVGSRKQVDPVKIAMQVDCLESKKMLGIIKFKQKCAGIRSRLESGAALTQSEVEFLEANEAEIYRYIDA